MRSLLVGRDHVGCLYHDPTKEAFIYLTSKVISASALRQRHSYLTGFLVPVDAAPSQRVDEDSTEEVDAASDAGGADDATTPEPASARQRYLPSSIGLSVLVSSATRQLKVHVRWGDYTLRKSDDGHGGQEEWERE